MKRTKDNWLEGHPADRNGISSLTFFDGEDKAQAQHKKQQQAAHKEWIETQISEKALQRQRLRDEDSAEAARLRELVQHSERLEQDSKNKFALVRAVNGHENAQLARELQEKKRLERAQQVAEEQEDLREQRRIRGYS